MSRGKYITTDKTFPAALRAFREQVLRVRTQVEMAANLGVSVYVYNNWEKGRSEPSIHEFVRILNLCPSEECRSSFGLIEPGADGKKEDGAKHKLKTVESEAQMGKGLEGQDDPELSRLNRQIQNTVRNLGERARSGDKAAQEILRAAAQAVVRVAGLATEPGISKARRAKLLEEEIKRLAKIV